MSRALVSRITTLAVALLLLASWVPPAEAQPLRQLSPSPWTLLARLWAFFAPASITTKAGCSLDPDGTPRCTASQPANGCSLDPHGACVESASTAEAGCSLDPSGACLKGD